jgi:hypothetical protein
MNAFDLVVTVALGSTLATVLLNKEVALAEGVLAFAVLIGLQFIVTWSSVRQRWIRQIVTGEPRMLNILSIADPKNENILAQQGIDHPVVTDTVLAEPGKLPLEYGIEFRLFDQFLLNEVKDSFRRGL